MSSRDASSPRTQTAWGPLALVEKIGEGSYGEVYRAHDPALDLDVALKLWFPRWSGDARLEDFIAEARTLARVRHPNVLSVLGAARHDGRVGMWTELLRGVTLEESLGERGRFGAVEAAWAGAELCRALAAVHEAGLIHRDVKTTNVMRAEGGRIVLMDFGSVAQATQLEHVGPDARIIGTPAAIAPEQLEGGTVTPRADLYALGTLLYRLVSRHYPIEASSLEDLIERHRREGGVPLRDWCPDLPYEFVELVERCLAREPGRRFASAGALERGLLEFVRSSPGATPTDAARPSAAPAPRHNLRPPLTRLVGRERERAQARALLGRSRLVTLTGVAGGGKTRLALSLAEGLLRGEATPSDEAIAAAEVWFVELAALNDPDHVLQAIARALGVGEVRDRSLLEGVMARIGAASMVLVLDNCEHVAAEAARAVMALLPSCPNLRVIATSREALDVLGEAILSVPPLPLPEAGSRTREAVEASEAVQMFAGAATLAHRDFRLTDDNAATVAEICRRLDGIPFALELAAARLRVLTPEEVLTKLDDRFQLLTGGSRWALSRHQTLLETLRWSHDHLAEDERLWLRRLAVFVGGCTLEAAWPVCEPERDAPGALAMLTRLVNKSLVVAERSDRGITRYHMLETVRLFALESLSAAREIESTRERHLDHFVAFAEAQGAALPLGTAPDDTLAACDAEHENLLAALAWCEKHPESDRALRIIGAIFPYWTHRTLFSLGLDQVLRALSRAAPGSNGRAFAMATFAASSLSFYRGHYAESLRYAERCLALFRAQGFDEGVVLALNALANVRMVEEDFAGSGALYEECLIVSRACGYRRGVAVALNNLAELAAEAGDTARALVLFQESVEINRALGRIVGVGLNLANVAYAFVVLERAGEAVEVMAECLEIAGHTRRRDHVGRALGVAALIAEQLCAGETAARLLAVAEVMREEGGVPVMSSELACLTAARERLRAGLGSEAFAVRLAEGKVLSFEAARESALAWLEGERAKANPRRAEPIAR